ncbi:Uncharacterized protein GBIM_08604 [Gryllus bimaculatus]|nr:Uncharacterized protein GBIM_08604 [Gryllus bimaculatus]
MLGKRGLKRIDKRNTRGMRCAIGSASHNASTWQPAGEASEEYIDNTKRPTVVQRLAQYEQFFQALQDARSHAQADPLEARADDAAANSAPAHAVGRVRARAKQALRRGQVASDLERIQDLFPHDDLRLHDREALTMVSTCSALPEGQPPAACARRRGGAVC